MSQVEDVKKAICSFVASYIICTFFTINMGAKIKGLGSENRISCKILNLKYFLRLSENMNVLLYFVWDVYCLRKQRDQVNTCSFTLLKSSAFVYVVTMHSDHRENCRVSMKSFFIE